MSGSLSFFGLILVISAAAYYFVGRWASDQLYDRGYPVWLGWVVALTGFIPTLIIVHMLPSRRAESERQIMLAAHMELARQNAGLPAPGYGTQAPPVWGGPRQPPPATPIGFQQVPEGTQPAAPGTHYSSVAPNAGFAPPRWVPPDSLPNPAGAVTYAGGMQAVPSAPSNAARCGGCEFLIAPERATCPNCGLPAS